ncbi:RagB/SusD family nutrient uptake outer membrane protein [Lacibacter sediminis]|uniref:RagB/SusD family nutrient uptake outer membrane protein n=1 Tax=Lacibacter sediminis TaxID=2760713 RepID=A0A7G5XKF1_9BACT|nr:RagB/SusD family nutrient uptake outer membrane protein [Lacibacter sediminis]QNA45954.1 RagB/SusD family nutrient uptake outer membrane protein [Lacibacter sediminis]
MNKLYKIIFGALGIILLNSSCKKWLTEENFTQISSDVIYKDEAGLTVGLGALYNLQRTYERVSDANGLTQNNLWVYCADDLGCTRTFNDAQIYKANMTPTNFPTGKWNSGYQLIDRASAIISKAPSITFSSAANKNKLIAEAKVIRAMTYFKLWQLYDNILIDTIPTDVTNAFDEVTYAPAAKADVLNLINADLDYAIANLPYTAKPGQVSQGLARHLRAQVASWQSDWTTMAAQCDAIINNGGYSLQAIDKVFGADVNHKESIYTFQYDEITGGTDALSGGSQHILSAVFTARYYEMPGGHMIEDNNWGGNSFAWTTPNNYLKSLMSWDPATGLSPDKRFSTYFYPDTVIGNKPTSPYYGLKLPKSSYPDNYRQYHWSIKKYQDFSKPDGRAGSFKDVIVYRLAETLLMGAEAHWRKSGNPADPTALLYINRVRTRAGMPGFTSIDQKTILEESARELAFEGGRWFLLKRMGVLISQVNQYHTFGSAKTNEAVFPMQSHMVRWPIPQSQIDLMAPNFPQNPNY